MYKASIFDSQTVDGATNSGSQNLRFIDNFAVQVVVTNSSSPSGASVKLQASNDDSNWTDVDGTSTNITGDGDILLNIADPGYKYVRLSFAISSGSFDASALITGRERKI